MKNVFFEIFKYTLSYLHIFVCKIAKKIDWRKENQLMQGICHFIFKNKSNL